MLTLIHKDLIRRLRSPVPTVVMLIFPLFMTVMIGTISRAFSGDKTPRIKVMLLDRDKTSITQFILGGFQQDEMAERFEALQVGEEGFHLMEQGKASALVVFPKGFGDSLLARQSTYIQVVRNPAEGIFPEIVEVGAGVLSTFLDQGVRLAGEDLAQIQAMTDRDQFPQVGEVVAFVGSLMNKLTQARPVLFPPLVKLTSVKEEDTSPAAKANQNRGSFIMGYLLIMTTVMAVLFVATRSIMDLFEERQSGMLRRQLVSPLPVSQIVGAKIVFAVLFTLIVLAMLATIGAVMRWFRGPINGAGVVLLSVAFSTAACGLLALIFSITKTVKQAGAISWILIMGMSTIGGSMMPIEAMPAALQKAAPMTLNYWAVKGYQKLVLDHAPFMDAARSIGTLALFGVVTISLSYFFIVRRIHKGFA